MKFLSNDEIRYYSRQIRLKSVGEEGQTRLKRASVLIIGLGGLGSPVSLYLASAGLGRIGVVEFDRIEESNLHRQILYTFDQVGKLKLQEGSQRLRALNPHIQIEPHAVFFNESNARELVRGYDLVIDASDNFNTRYLVNDACLLEKKPFISAAIEGFEGQISVFNFEGGPCLRCVYPNPPQAGSVLSCDELGVFGVLPGVMGSFQANEALKIFLKTGEVASGRLVCFDALTLKLHDFKISKKENCRSCGSHSEFTQLEKSVAHDYEISAHELRALMDAQKNLILVDVRDASERAFSKIEGSLHVALEEIMKGRFEFSKENAVVFYCEQGARSLKAAQYFSRQGFGPAKSLKGGIRSYFSTG